MFNLSNFDRIELIQNIQAATYNNKNYEWCTLELKSYDCGQTWNASLNGIERKKYYSRRKRITYKNGLTYKEAQEFLNLIKIESL